MRESEVWQRGNRDKPSMDREKDSEAAETEQNGRKLEQEAGVSKTHSPGR